MRGSAEAGRDRGDVAERDAGAGRADRDVADLVGVLQLGERAHREAELTATDGAAGGGRVGRLDRGGDVVRREAERADALGVDVDADLVVGIAHHGHARRRRRSARAAARARRWRCARSARRSPGPVRPRTAIGRSPGSEVSSVGRAAVLGSAPRMLSSFSRTVSTVFCMSVPHAKRSVVLPSPLRLTERMSTRPGVLPTSRPRSARRRSARLPRRPRPGTRCAP